MPTKKTAASKGRKKAATKKAAAKKRPSKGAAAATGTRVRPQQDYRAKAGDTLKSVAERFQVPLKFLARANNLAEAARLSPGTIIRIPELQFDPFDRLKGGWVEIAPIWYQKGTAIGEDRIIVEKTQRKTLKG
jgi:LysM repeat protein